MEDYCNILSFLTGESEDFHRSMIIEDMVTNIKGPISTDDSYNLRVSLDITSESSEFITAPPNSISVRRRRIRCLTR